jgi:hypothetical protein
VGDGENKLRHQSLALGFGDGTVTGVGVGVAKLNGEPRVNGLLNGSGVDFRDTVGLGLGLALAGENITPVMPFPSNRLPRINGLELGSHQIP